MDILHNFSMQCSSADLYNALGTQSGIEGWWCKDCDIAQQTGGVSVMRFVKEGRIVQMDFRVDTLDEKGEVAWTCVQNGNPAWLETKLIFTWTSKGDGVDFSFRHVFDDKWAGQEAFEQTKGGWVHFMDSLRTYCEGGSGQPW